MHFNMNTLSSLVHRSDSRRRRLRIGTRSFQSRSFARVAPTSKPFAPGRHLLIGDAADADIMEDSKKKSREDIDNVVLLMQTVATRLHFSMAVATRVQRGSCVGRRTTQMLAIRSTR